VHHYLLLLSDPAAAAAAAAAMLSGELKAAASKLQKEQAQRAEKERQRLEKERILAERQRQRQQQREEEARAKRLEAAAAAAAVRDTCMRQPTKQQYSSGDDSVCSRLCWFGAALAGREHRCRQWLAVCASDSNVRDAAGCPQSRHP
jgi:hypothetical protein